MGAMRKLVAAVAMAGLLGSGATQAALIDRGGGLIYDSTLNITWLQDANYASTSGYDADGRMHWNAAKAWADGLVYGGYGDWRLPTTIDTGTPGCNASSFGGTDCGFNVVTSTSEMAYMFHVNLGNRSYYLPGTSTESGCYDAPTYTCLDNVGPFANVQSYVYWSGTVNAPLPATGAWYFNTFDGSQYYDFLSGEFYAWAVRSGDVGSVAGNVPEPSSMMLVGLALAGLAAVRRRRRCGAA